MRVEALPTEAAWLEARSHGIGASEAPALLGHGYRSLLELWCAKTGRYSEERDEDDRLRLDVGHDLEPRLQRVAERKLDMLLADPGDYTIFWDGEAAPYRFATIDRLALKRTVAIEGLNPTERNGLSSTWLSNGTPLEEWCLGPVELKTVTIHQRDAWQAEPTPYVLLQVQWQLMVLGMEHAWVAAIFGLGEGAEVYPVQRHPEIQRLLAEHAKRFWKHVQADTPPAADGTESAKRSLQLLYPKDSGQSIELPEEFLDMAERRRQIKEILKGRQMELDGIENAIRQAMGDATIATIGGYPKAFRWQVEPRHEPAREARDLFPRVLREVKAPKP